MLKALWRVQTASQVEAVPRMWTGAKSAAPHRLLTHRLNSAPPRTSARLENHLDDAHRVLEPAAIRGLFPLQYLSRTPHHHKMLADSRVSSRTYTNKGGTVLKY